MLCNLSPKSCFLVSFLGWLPCFVFLLYHPRVFSVISVSLWNCNRCYSCLVLSGRRQPRPRLGRVPAASLLLCAQSAVCSLQHVLFAKILGWGGVKCDSSILLILFFFYCGLLKEDITDWHHCIQIVDGQGNRVCMVSQNHTVRIRKALCPEMYLDFLLWVLTLPGRAVGQVGVLRFSFDLKAGLPRPLSLELVLLECCWVASLGDHPPQESRRGRMGNVFPDVSLCKYGANVNLCWDCGEWCFFGGWGGCS